METKDSAQLNVTLDQLKGHPVLDGVRKHLRSIIQECIGGSCGDPDYSQMLTAAHAFLALKDLGGNAPIAEKCLRGDNAQSTDFIEYVEKTSK
jgi:hypothetical protein